MYKYKWNTIRKSNQFAGLRLCEVINAIPARKSVAIRSILVIWSDAIRWRQLYIKTYQMNANSFKMPTPLKRQKLLYISFQTVLKRGRYLCWFLGFGPTAWLRARWWLVRVLLSHFHYGFALPRQPVWAPCFVSPVPKYTYNPSFTYFPFRKVQRFLDVILVTWFRRSDL